jgi:organic radical activating enzyme
MIKKIIYSPTTKKIYDLVKDIPLIKQLLAPLANRASLNYLATTKAKLDAISPSLCTAKWLQSTLHLEIGETHSCHHPKRHKLDLEEIKLDPKRLHNTKLKEKNRRLMLAGDKPSECEYCWLAERNNEYSDRIYKSASDWAQVNLKKLTTDDSIKNINPTYLEVSFSSDCNLRCAYCYPEVSSAIRNENTKFGPYPTSDQFGNLSEYEKFSEDLSEHFWRWWNNGLRDDLKVLRVTGGEPLLSKDLYKLVEMLKENPEKYHFDFSINSNFMVAQDRINKLFFDIKEILAQKKIKSFHFYTSIDTWGSHAEFLRFGLKIDKFVENIESALNIIPDLDLTFMITYQALSPFHFNQLLEFILDLRKRYPHSKIKAGITGLLNPHFLSVFILDKSFLIDIENNLEFMRKHRLSTTYPQGFSNFEIQHLERIHAAFIAQMKNQSIDLSDTKIFFEEYEKRKNIKFNQIFSPFPKLINYLMINSSPAE